MVIPEEFLTFTAFFHQDFDLLFPNGEGLIEDAISHTKLEHQNIIKSFIDDLLSGKFTEDELRMIWRSTRAEISPFRGTEGSCTEFLKLIRSFLA
ncbi:contact-dependent growth inhibition system immunity protein [Methylocystis echinoides]|jgi:hypothetical protein|uniref:contact-dependent growth inhibition system immunity protein n=1 Tax=Methylocystis echinoides TaxID=29468 RepID=UPI003412F35C